MNIHLGYTLFLLSCINTVCPMQQTTNQPITITRQHPLSIQQLPIYRREGAARTVAATALLVNALSLQENHPPTDITQNTVRNQELFRLFNEAQRAYTSQEDCIEHIGSVFLWKKLGQSFYPGCAHSRELEPIIHFITQHKHIEKIVLGTYVQKYPKLYCHVLRTFKNSILTPTFSPNGEIVALCVGPNIELINITSGAVLGIFTNASCPVFSPNGQTIATTLSNSAVAIYNIHDGSIVRTFADADTLAFSLQGDIVAVSSFNGVSLLRLHDSVLIKNFPNAFHPVFHPNGESIALCIGNHIELRSIRDGSIINTFENAHTIAFHPQGNIAALNFSNNAINLMNIHTNTIIRIIENACHPTFSPDGQKIVVFSTHQHSCIKLIALHDGSTIRFSTNACRPIFSPEGNLLVLFHNNTLRLCGYVSLREALQKIL